MKPERNWSTTTRLTAFGVAIAVVVGGAYAVGRATDDPSAKPGMGAQHASGGMAMSSGEHQGASTSKAHEGMAMGADQPLGLTASSGDLKLDLQTTRVEPGPSTISFRILGPSNAPVMQYDDEFTKLMHVIIVPGDLAGYQHLHPDLDATGTWTVPAKFAAPGSYRVVADFSPTGGERTVLSSDVRVAGQAPAPVPLPAPVSQLHVDGFTVGVADGDLAPGREGTLAITVTRDGTPARLEPYLGSFGHAVLMREGDLAYLHVHPESADERAAKVTFAAQLPSAARYRAFVQFQVAGVVHVAAFTVDGKGAS